MTTVRKGLAVALIVVGAGCADLGALRASGDAGGAGQGGAGTDGGVHACSSSGSSGTNPCPAATPLCQNGVCGEPPSCQGLASSCGPDDNQSCCSSPLVTGGTFYRSYDGITTSPEDYTKQSWPAKVGDFRLDKFEVTVGRFRKFVADWDGGWRPAAGAGKHKHLNGGNGLLDSTDNTSYEPGWDSTWTSELASDEAGWETNLKCNSMWQTWTPAPGSNENRPINCVDWYEAYAFCIWDSGFLPSEAEWNYAAAGGSEQRVYPWSNPATSTSIDCSYANYKGASGDTDYCVLPGTGSTNDVGSESPTGDGKWGQSDLAGNVSDWNLDWNATYSSTCDNCANFTPAANRVLRGGGFHYDASILLSAYRYGNAPTYRYPFIGVRCARIP